MRTLIRATMLDLMARSGWRRWAIVVAAVVAAATGCGPAARHGTTVRAAPPVELLVDPATEGNLQAVNPATCAVRDVGLPRFPTPTFQRDHAGYVTFRPMPGGDSLYTQPTGVFIGRLGEGEPKSVWTMGNFVPERMAAWDREGQRVAMVLATTGDRVGRTAPGGVEQGLWVVKRSGAHRHLGEGPTEAGSALAWSPDGRAIAYVSFEGVVTIVDADTGAHRILATIPTGDRTLDWSPDGRSIVVATARYEAYEVRSAGVSLVAVADGKVTPLFASDASAGDRYSDVVFSADGRDIYAKRSHQGPQGPQSPGATIPVGGLPTDQSEIVRIPVTGGSPAVTCAVPRYARLLDWD